MYAIVYKSDGVPVCCQVPGIAPDPVVFWTSEGAAREFIQKQGGEADFDAVEVNDDSMEAIAKALGCPVENLMFEQYPA